MDFEYWTMETPYSFKEVLNFDEVFYLFSMIRFFKSDQTWYSLQKLVQLKIGSIFVLFSVDRRQFNILVQTDEFFF